MSSDFDPVEMAMRNTRLAAERDAALADAARMREALHHIGETTTDTVVMRLVRAALTTDETHKTEERG